MRGGADEDKEEQEEEELHCYDYCDYDYCDYYHYYYPTTTATVDFQRLLKGDFDTSDL